MLIREYCIQQQKKKVSQYGFVYKISPPMSLWERCFFGSLQGEGETFWLILRTFTKMFCWKVYESTIITAKSEAWMLSPCHGSENIFSEFVVK